MCVLQTYLCGSLVCSKGRLPTVYILSKVWALQVRRLAACFSTSRPFGKTRARRKNPEGYFEAGGHLNYSQSRSSVEINTKIFNYVESILKNSNDPNEKLKATLFLFQEVTHEAAHELRGYDKNGMKVSEYRQRELSGSDSYGEDGEMFEKTVWGTSEESDNKKPKYIKGISSDNAKNDVGNLEKNIKKASTTEEGKKTLPTVPK